MVETENEIAEEVFYIALEIHCDKWDQVHISW